MSRWRRAPELADGLRLLEDGQSRQAHEAFEEAWRAHRGRPVGEAARALAQWAAACLHRAAGRESGYRGLATKCARTLATASLDAELDTRALAAWIDARAREAPAGDALLPPA
ncbi:MAG: DUF309 domain-containing protein [Planctomycetes bacterium]|nr:DUF309 domain-containing protein [Planctomycetota bacterium]